MGDWLTQQQRSRNMAAIRSSGTRPERVLYGLIRQAFPRRRVVGGKSLPGKPDYFLPGLRLAIFADGCFWHLCPQHGRIPEDNSDYWRPKLTRNQERDRLANQTLRRQGIRVVRLWEHDLKRDGTPAARRLRRVARDISRLRASARVPYA